MECNKIKKDFSGFLENNLPQEEKEEIVKHLSSCKNCRHELEKLEKALGLLRNLDDVEPPAWLTQTVMAKIRKEEAFKKGLWERFLGRSFFAPPAAALATVAVAVIAIVIFKSTEPGRIMMTPSAVPSVQAPSQEPKRDESKTLRNYKDAQPLKNAGVQLDGNKVREDMPLHYEKAGTPQSTLQAKNIASSEKIITPAENMAAPNANPPAGEALAKADPKIQAANKVTASPAMPAEQEMMAQAGPGLSSERVLQGKAFERKSIKKASLANKEEVTGEGKYLRRNVIERYENGRPKTVVTYSIISGQQKKLMTERFDESGLRNGLFEAYDHTGKVTLAVEYHHGEVVSVRQLTAEGTYRNGSVSESWPWLKK